MTEPEIPFVPPAPVPRTTPPSRLQIIRTVMRNPLELWGEPSFRLEWLKVKLFSERTLIVNHPGLIRHVLVDNARNYEMAVIRQLILRPILRDGLLTAEGEVWKRTRKAIAPVFTPRHAPRLCCSDARAVPRHSPAATRQRRRLAKCATSRST